MRFIADQAVIGAFFGGIAVKFGHIKAHASAKEVLCQIFAPLSFLFVLMASCQHGDHGLAE